MNITLCFYVTHVNTDVEMAAGLMMFHFSFFTSQGATKV